MDPASAMTMSEAVKNLRSGSGNNNIRRGMETAIPQNTAIALR